MLFRRETDRLASQRSRARSRATPHARIRRNNGRQGKAAQLPLMCWQPKAKTCLPSIHPVVSHVDLCRHRHAPAADQAVKGVQLQASEPANWLPGDSWASVSLVLIQQSIVHVCLAVNQVGNVARDPRRGGGHSARPNQPQMKATSFPFLCPLSCSCLFLTSSLHS